MVRSVLVAAVLLASIALGRIAAAETHANPALGIPSEELKRFEFLPQRPDLERIVTAAYDRLERYSQAAGTPLIFRLSDFQTLYGEQLAEIPFLDMADMPGGRVVDVTRSVTRDFEGVETAVYRAQWSIDEASWGDTDEGRSLATLSAAQAFARTAEEVDDYAGIVAMTTFQVRVKLENRSRRYRAAVLWRPDADVMRTRLIFVDRIVQGIQEAATEPLPAVRPIGVMASPPLSKSWSGATCEPSYEILQRWNRSAGSSLGHLSGKHWSYAEITAVCSCDSSCKSTCRPQLGNLLCDDSGSLSTGQCHRMGRSEYAGLAEVVDGHLSPATCVGGFGCIMNSCFGCLCGASVTVSPAGQSVTFSLGSDAQWQGNLQLSVQCPKCKKVDCSDPTYVIDPAEGSLEEQCGEAGGATTKEPTGNFRVCQDVHEYGTGRYLGTCCGKTTAELLTCAAKL